ncbi:MAG: MBOAT family protein [Deltaproteobacteria bacterium]|nr:MBOAT family protein [Deltaproteobacteria bacterium]
MLFNTLHFLLFYPLVTASYFALPSRWRWLLLLSASCYFYMAFVPVYILILAFTIAVDYVAGILIENAAGPRRRRFLLLSLFANVGVLAFFKYYGFATANLVGLASLIGWNYSIPALEILLPIGLSFHTFQSMAYAVEVYRGNQKAERHLGIFALYVMFYPQLVAGPIERPQNLLPQLRAEHSFSYDDMTSGLRLMLWGLVKKMVIADRLAIYVNEVYGHLPKHSGTALVIATVFFAFQIYCDFSGYSDVAIGSARTMGFRLMTNFQKPYLARSIGEFWRRWHISLSTFFRDFVYIPLGGNRGSRLLVYRNLLVTFAVSGLWHGANWTFVAWGALHGGFMVASEVSRGLRARLTAAFGRAGAPGFLLDGLSLLFTFVLVCLAWVFFRAASLADATYVLTHMLDGTHLSLRGVETILGRKASEFWIAVWSIVVLVFVEAVDARLDLGRLLGRLPGPGRFLVYVSGGLLLMNLGIPDDLPFIYFQF